jgi:hypothetical protein
MSHGPRWAAAFPALLQALLMRLLREGMLVRALVWPGALVGLALIGSALLVALLTRNPAIAVDDPNLVAPFEQAGFDVSLVDDPARSLRDGDVRRATWVEGGRRVLGLSVAGRDGLRAEAILRDAIGAGWRLDVPPPPGRSADLDGQSTRLAALVAVLYALYGIVLGAGALVRDREQGVLEVDLSLPHPAWVHGLARQLAPALALGLGLLATLWLVGALLGLPESGRWWREGTCAATATVSLGTLLAAGWRGPLLGRGGAADGLTVPLSRGLTGTTSLLALGWAAPEVGRFLPVSSLAALAQGAAPAFSTPLVGLLLLGIVAWRFGVGSR